MKNAMAVLLLMMMGLNSMADQESISLPPLLVTENGKTITTAEEWTQLRRPELLEWFRANMYGRAPVERPPEMHFTVFETDPHALNGKATRKQVRIDFTDDAKGPYINLLIYVPNNQARPAPVFLGTNARGNHTVTDDPAVVETGKRSLGQPDTHRRGANASAWPIEEIIARGYALAVFHTSDVSPDFADGHLDGVQSIFDPLYYPNGRPDDAWGTISVWAWGLSRAIDYLETDPDIDPHRIAVTGLSRRGKAALWCGIQDERVALTISQNSVGQGSSLARVAGGNDTVSHLINYSPFWFCETWKTYNGMDDRLPVDQHMFLALVAPRPLYVASAETDKFAIPLRDHLACKAASPAWNLFGLTGYTPQALPAVDQPVHDGCIGYHIRTGPHGHTREDWLWEMDYADRYLRSDNAH